MTDRRDEELDEGKAAEPAAPGRATPEGVRILGAEEAQAALDAGTVGRRLGDQDTRYGDVPARPDPAIRPSVRFPRSADEPAPDVVPRASAADDEDGRDDAYAYGDDDDGSDRAISLLEDSDPTLVEGVPTAGSGSADAPVEPDPDLDDDLVLRIDELADDEPEPDADETPAGDDEEVVVEVPEGEVPSATLPHWTEPPTGEMPLLLPEAEPVDLTGEESLDAYTAAASTATGPRFLTGVGDWAQEEYESIDALGDDTTNVGALAAAPEDDDTAFDREVAARRRIRPRTEAGARASAGGAAARRATRPPDAELVVPGTEPDLTTRVITGVGIAVLALICLKLGRDATMVLATAIVGLASLELFQGLQRRGFRPATILAVLGSIAIVPIAFNRGEFAFPFTLAIVTVFALLWYLFQVVRARPVVNVAVTVMGFVYVGVLGGFAGLLLSYQNGVGLILGVVLCVVGYDVFGYLVGSQLGKRRLVPDISPNKTIEGLVGGMIASVLVAVVIVKQITPWGDLTDALALGLTVAVMAPLGDLCESMIKRDLGVKDFGTLLPGHGGILDRFDAILFCLPAVYYLARALTIG
ncbi:MAG TPA: phosphatidate cytidylyltransferase [Acidimicrobiia bacterium]